MKTKISLLLASIVFAAAASAQAGGAAHTHAHTLHGAEQPGAPLPDGRKWDADEHLRTAMSSINKAMGAALSKSPDGKFSDAQYGQLATTITEQATYALEHCKMDQSAADAQLHVILADLMAGAELMEGGDEASRLDGVEKVHKGLDGYGEYFSHPGWSPAKSRDKKPIRGLQHGD